MLVILVALASAAQAAPIELRSLKAAPKALLKVARLPAKSRFYQVNGAKGAAELVAVSFVNRGSGWLEVYAKKGPSYSRISIVEFPNISWAQQEIGATGLSENPKDPGVLLFIWSGKEVSLLPLPSGWTGPKGELEQFSGSEFSTTGWSTVNIEHDPVSGLVRVDERHESPGEETEEGRKMDVFHVFYTWDPKSQRFIKSPEK